MVELKLKLTQDGMIQKILCTCATVVRLAVKSPCTCIWLLKLTEYPLPSFFHSTLNLRFDSRGGVSMFVVLTTGTHLQASTFTNPSSVNAEFRQSNLSLTTFLRSLASVWSSSVMSSFQKHGLGYTVIGAVWRQRLVTTDSLTTKYSGCQIIGCFL